MDPETVELVRAALDDSARVDARRIEIQGRDDALVLVGSVSEPEEATAAALIAEQYADRVVNDLRVDRGLREGAVDPHRVEPTIPPEDEIPIGSTDMLAGPDAEITSDVNEAMEESLPWDPPTEPSMAPTRAEEAGAEAPGGGGVIEPRDREPDMARSDYAAADLSQEDLTRAARDPDSIPSLDPTGVAASLPDEDPAEVSTGGEAPPGYRETMPDPLPGASAGPPVTGEGTAGGGGMGGTPAPETGAAGADTASADPVRSTGGSMTDSGTERGPESRDDEAIREDFRHKE